MEEMRTKLNSIVSPHHNDKEGIFQVCMQTTTFYSKEKEIGLTLVSWDSQDKKMYDMK